MASPTPKLTIAIPFFNEARALPFAIRSVFAQSFTDWELLLVDDGSTDGSLEIAKSVQDTRVRVVADGARRRLPARLNQIVREARADLVARMDADDIMHPHRIAHQIAVLDDDRGLAAVGTKVAYQLAEHLAPTVVDMGLPSSGQEVLLRGTMPHATMIARRAFLQRFPYDEDLDRTEDRDLFCRTFRLRRFGLVPAPLYVIRPGHDEAGFLAGYVEASRQNRRLFLRHGPRLAGAVATSRAVLGSFAREALYRTADATGLMTLLVGRRGRSATASEAALVSEAGEAARATFVPGLLQQSESPVAQG